MNKGLLKGMVIAGFLACAVGAVCADVRRTNGFEDHKVSPSSGGVVPVFNLNGVRSLVGNEAQTILAPVKDRLTLAVWFRADCESGAGGDYNAIFATGGRNGALGPAILYMNNNPGKQGVGIFLSGKSGGAAECLVPGDFCDGRWHHLVGTFDCTTLTAGVYVDGVGSTQVCKSGKTLHGTLKEFPRIQRVAVACDGWQPSGRLFNGSVQEASLWDRVLSAQEVAAAYASKTRLVGNETGLVGYWPLNDAPSPGVAANGSFYETTLCSPMIFHDGPVSWEHDANLPLKAAAPVSFRTRVAGSPDFSLAHASRFPTKYTYPDQVGTRPVKWFTVDKKEVGVVIPEHPLPGKPWMWAFEWPWTGATTTRCDARDPTSNEKNDIGWYKFIQEGYYYVYVDVGPACMGNDATMILCDKVYRFLVRELGFDPQFVSLGISRGGWNAYRFAQAFPERFKYMYNDAPVCDLRSWPGVGDNMWNRYAMAVPQFHDTAERLAWDGAMTNAWTLAPIAAKKVKMLNLVGDRDTVVAPERNTLALAANYRALGGEIDIVVKPDYGHVHGLTTDEITPLVNKLVAATKTVAAPCVHARVEPFEAVSARCLRNGRTGGWRCTACGQVVAGGDWTPMLGHAYVTNAVGGVSCARCQTVYSTRSAEGCAHANRVPAGPSWSPSCLGAGVTAGEKCADCGTVLTPQKRVSANIRTAKDNHPYQTVSDAGGRVSLTCRACGIGTGERK